MSRVLRIVLIIVGILALVLLVGPFLVPVPPVEGTVPPEQLADADSRFAEIEGLQVHYKTAGSGEPALILLHGFGASMFSWHQVMEPLGELGTVAAFDRPGSGLTERLLRGEWEGESPYSMVSQVEITVGLMDELGIEQAILVGNSAGGTVAMETALAYPQRVRGLILVDPAIYRGGSPAWIRPLLRLPQIRRLGPLIIRRLSTSGGGLLDSAWHDPSLVTPEIREGYEQLTRVDNWDQGFWELTLASRPSRLEERLDEVTLPVLVITGDDDRIVPTEESIRLAGELPDAELIVLPECGHLPQEECPAAFMDAMRAYLNAQGLVGG